MPASLCSTESDPESLSVDMSSGKADEGGSIVIVICGV